MTDRRDPPPDTLLDRLIGWINPAAGVDRRKARHVLALTGGYNAGRKDRRSMRRWKPGGYSADADTLPDLPELRGRARDLVRNVPVAAGAIRTNVTNIVGSGLMLQARIDRERLGLTEEQASDWQKTVEAEFRLFCRCADFEGGQTFDELQALVIRTALESGDAFAIRRFRERVGEVYGTRIQIVEADRVCNKDRAPDSETMVAGIQHDGDGRAIGAWIANRHPGDYRAGVKAIDWRFVPYRYTDGRQIVLHVAEKLRPGQTRGVPYLAPVIEALKQFADYTDAEIRGAVVAAMFAVFITSPAAGGDSPLVGNAPSDASTTDTEKETELGSGAIHELRPGEEIDLADPKRPNTGFDSFTVAFLRHVGVALGLPFEILVQHFTASYSASRAALEMAWQSFRCRRIWLASRFCQPVYEMWLEEAILRGRIDAPMFFDDPLIRMAWSGSEWIGPSRISIDPKKDAEADAIDVETGVKSRRRIIIERTGGDFDATHEQLAYEHRRREQDGLDSAAAMPTPISQASDGDQTDDDTDAEDDE